MPKQNAILMVVLAVAVLAATGILVLESSSARDETPAQAARLLRMLADPDPDIQREGETGLRKMGGSAVGPLEEASKSPDRVMAVRAARLLQEFRPPATVPAAPEAAN